MLQEMTSLGLKSANTALEELRKKTLHGMIAKGKGRLTAELARERADDIGTRVNMITNKGVWGAADEVLLPAAVHGFSHEVRDAEEVLRQPCDT